MNGRIGRPWKSSRELRGNLHARRPRFVIGYVDGDAITLGMVAKAVLIAALVWATLVVVLTAGTAVAS